MFTLSSFQLLNLRTLHCPGTKDGSLRDSESGTSAFALLNLPTLRKVGKRAKDLDEEEDVNESSEEAGGFKDSKKSLSAKALSADPERYLNAKRKLKKAVLEHYRFVTPFFYLFVSDLDSQRPGGVAQLSSLLIDIPGKTILNYISNRFSMSLDFEKPSKNSRKLPR